MSPREHVDLLTHILIYIYFISCQCGVSRSATLAIAYVMRAAQASDANNAVRALKNQGMQGAYNFVKEKSQWIGPNMSYVVPSLNSQPHMLTGVVTPDVKTHLSIIGIRTLPDAQPTCSLGFVRTVRGGRMESTTTRNGRRDG